LTAPALARGRFSSKERSNEQIEFNVIDPVVDPELRELLAETSAPDLPVEMKDLSALIQTNSLELVAGDAKEFPGAAPGDHVLPRDGERILIKGSTGYRYMILDAWEGFPEFRLNRGGYVGPHDDKPGDAVWLKAEHSPDGKAGLYRVGGDGSPGNRIEHTIYVRVLVLPDDGSAPFIVTQSYKSTAKTIANDMLNRASRKLDGEDVANYVTSLWRMTSRLEKKDSFRWFGPVATLLGRFGEPNGPTAEQLSLAAQLRKALKRGAALGPLAPPEPLPAPSIESEPTAPTARPVITSGRVRAVETPPLPDRYDGPGDFDDFTP
jgi:hypothetical protein